MTKSKAQTPAPLVADDDGVVTLQHPEPFRTAYGPKLRVQQHTTPGRSRTKQSFKAECDINAIMKRYLTTGVLQNLAKGEPRYLDCTGADYLNSMNTIAGARSLFEALPAEIRLEFKNDPMRLLEFAETASDADLARYGIKRDQASPGASTGGGQGGDSSPPRKGAPASSSQASSPTGEDTTPPAPPAKSGGKQGG